MVKDIIKRMHTDGRLTDEQVVNAIDKRIIDTTAAGEILSAIVTPVLAEDDMTVAAYDVDPIPVPVAPEMEAPDAV